MQEIIAKALDPERKVHETDMENARRLLQGAGVNSEYLVKVVADYAILRHSSTEDWRHSERSGMSV